MAARRGPETFTTSLAPGVLLKDPGVLLKAPGGLLQDPGVLLKDPGVFLKYDFLTDRKSSILGVWAAGAAGKPSEMVGV